MSTNPEKLALFSAFLNESPILVIDTKDWAREFIIKLLQSMKIKPSFLFQAGTFEDGLNAIEKHKPKMILCDYTLDEKTSLDLIPFQRKHFASSKDCLFILVTENTSQLAVAKASEDEVDAYILKPFTGDVLRDTVAKVAASRKEPDDYTKAIEEGKAALATQNLDVAQVAFTKALTLSSLPSLACYYLGQISVQKGAFPEAETFYIKGLNYNRIHYKCLSALYDVLMKQNKTADAYEVIKRTYQYYPGNSQRLTELLRLAIVTQNYEDIEKHYRSFSNVREKNGDLLKYLQAALLICGKYYLKQKLKSRGIALFSQALQAEQNNVKILKQVIHSLLEFSLSSDAFEFLQKSYGDQAESLEYKSLSYLIDDRRKQRSDLILIGQELIEKGYHDPTIYQILLRRLHESGLKPAAKKILDAGLARWPNLKSELEGILVNPAPENSS